ncbi:hypothetical protein O9G_005111 [Rozella allomycis CSF55]|uniref:Uncharacterized protein n=1 Tax=Rozella allomycis (strain CSF55) TaxID=988480 RepID=A0A075APX0_ROZAC|nr:hypothetical protein O9G_005111 [Rozella allomycis CSF55]|eukprot:EPZ32148.1 hypothetical protein O9G_005111 [Rozella allomycis CSF55]
MLTQGQLVSYTPDKLKVETTLRSKTDNFDWCFEMQSLLANVSMWKTVLMSCAIFLMKRNVLPVIQTLIQRLVTRCDHFFNAKKCWLCHPNLKVSIIKKGKATDNAADAADDSNKSASEAYMSFLFDSGSNIHLTNHLSCITNTRPSPITISTAGAIGNIIDSKLICPLCMVRHVLPILPTNQPTKVTLSEPIHRFNHLPPKYFQKLVGSSLVTGLVVDNKLSEEVHVIYCIELICFL